MSTSDQVRAILDGTVQAYRSDSAYAQRPDVHNELDWIGRRLNQPIRIALTGRTISPGVFDMMAILGPEETLARLGDCARLAPIAS